MGDYKPLLWGLGIIFGVGLFLMAFLSPFIDINELEDNWTEDYGVVGMTGLVFDLFKYPLSIVTSIGDFIGGNWVIFNAPTDSIAINITGTGLHNGDTLDGIYTLNKINDMGDNVSVFIFKKDDGGIFVGDDRVLLYTEKTYETYNIFGGEVLYATSFLTTTTIYNATGTSPNVLDVLTNINPSYDFNPTATGQYLVDENLDFSSITSKFWDFMDNTKEKAKDAVRGFGYIPEIIGVPIFLLLILGIIYAIIKLLPLT